jgi:hypothetical protein
MAETEQRFTLHARSRRIARIIGYPAGLGLLVAAVSSRSVIPGIGWW